jgi:hypothetical protein
MVISRQGRRVAYQLDADHPGAELHADRRGSIESALAETPGDVKW